MNAEARISTPVYLDPDQGPHCGSCSMCAIVNPFNPMNAGLCQLSDRSVNIRRPTTCNQYQPRRVQYP